MVATADHTPPLPHVFHILSHQPNRLHILSLTTSLYLLLGLPLFLQQGKFHPQHYNISWMWHMNQISIWQRCQPGPILSYFVRTNRAKYDNTILPIKIRFSPMSVFPLSLSFLLSYFLPNNNFSLPFYLASLFGGNPTKIKSWRSILHYLPRSHFCCICSLYCTVLHALCSLWLYPVIYSRTYLGVAPTVLRSSCSCPYTQFCVRKNPCDF